MTHKSRIDWCVLASIAMAIVLVLTKANYWITLPVLLVLLLCAYPQSYETAAEGLAVRDALARRVIPYHAITLVAPHTGSLLWGERIRIEYGLNSDLLIAPADSAAFLADLGARTPHLARRGQKLVLREAQLEYSFTNARRAYRMG
jgi:hypothetical protein